MENRKIALLLILLSVFTGLFAQPKRTTGLSALIQEGQLGISIPIWVSPRLVIAPGFDVVYAEKAGADLSFGVAPRYYLKTERLSPYLGLKAGTIMNLPSKDNKQDTKTKFDLIGGVAFGGEYFVLDQLSIGVEAQVNFTKSDKNSDRFGNPGKINFNTATALFATIYF